MTECPRMAVRPRKEVPPSLSEQEAEVIKTEAEKVETVMSSMQEHLSSLQVFLKIFLRISI